MLSKLTIILSLLAAANCLPPTNVLIIESSVCERCKTFNTLLPVLLNVPEFEKLVDWSIIKTVHLKEERAKDNSFIYTHQYGEEFLLKAKVQHCANKLYPNIVSLKWAAHEAINKSKAPFNLLVKEFFKEDLGAAVLACANGPKGNEYTREAFILHSYLKFTGLLPYVVLNKSKLGLVLNHNFDMKNIIKIICEKRADKAQLLACRSKSNPEFLKYLDTEYDFSYDLAENESTEFDFGLQEETQFEKSVETDTDKIVDYEKFWKTYDD